jgi:S1-C subfamily serine protease
VGPGQRLAEGVEPIDRVLDIATKLISVERVGNTWHGIVARTTGGRGVVVETIRGESPAASVGMKAGDVIVSVGDVPVARQFDIERALLGRKAGEAVSVTVVRAGAEERITLPLASVTGRARGGAGGGREDRV